jgi:hypothetical protein
VHLLGFIVRKFRRAFCVIPHNRPKLVGMTNALNTMSSSCALVGILLNLTVKGRDGYSAVQSGVKDT